MKKNWLVLLKPFVIYLVLFLLLFCNFSCKNNITGPIQGSRDYTWTVDTLYSPNNSLYSIWGASPDDIWLGGPGGITNYDELWHYDGENWAPYSKYLVVYPNCIYGFASNNIWLGGNDGKIFHYDGTNWTQSYTYNHENANLISIDDIWGKSPNNIYAVGSFFVTNDNLKSFILHYDGTNWKEEYVTDFFVQFLKLRQENGQSFLSALKLSKTSAPDTVLFYSYNNKKLTEIYSNTLDKISYASMNMIGDKVYFLIENNLDRYIGNKEFVKVFTFNIANFGYQVFGRNESDIFLVMNDGLAHFDGYNIQYLWKFEGSNTSISGYPLFFDNDVFFPAKDYINGGNLVLHGKLKN